MLRSPQTLSGGRGHRQGRPLLATGASAVRALSIAIGREALGRWSDGEKEIIGILKRNPDRVGISNVITPREDLREGKPIDASEFAVHLNYVRDGRAQADYQNPERFFE